MKKYILTIAFILSVLTTSYAQVAAFRDSLTLSDTVNVHHLLQGQNWDFAHITITLSNAGDTVKVYTGTNYALGEISSYADNDFTQVGVVDKITDSNVQVITGSTTKKGYLIKNSPRHRNIKLDATANTGEITYTIEVY